MIDRLKRYLAARRATGDIVRLFSGEMTPIEEEQLSHWRSDSPAYRHSFLCTNHLIAELRKLEEDSELTALVAKPRRADRSPLSQRVGGRQWVPATALAATVLLCIGFAVYTVNQLGAPTNDILRYVTMTGEQKTIRLADGSVVLLNTATRLLVDISPTARRIILERGEAYFDIAQDAQRPFTVDLGSRAVSVLGTQFNIFKSPEKFTLAVVEGAVTIHRQDEVIAGDSLPLVAPGGQRVQVRVNGQHRVNAGTVAEFDVEEQKLIAYMPPDIAAMHSWKTGVISFDDEPLYKVIKELNRYSAKKILIEDKSIMDLKLFATVRLQRPEQAVVGFEHTLPIKVISYVDRIVIVGRDK